jgi:hypothetical protein
MKTNKQQSLIDKLEELFPFLKGKKERMNKKNQLLAEFRKKFGNKMEWIYLEGIDFNKKGHLVRKPGAYYSQHDEFLSWLQSAFNQVETAEGERIKNLVHKFDESPDDMAGFEIRIKRVSEFFEALTQGKEKK